MQMPEMSASASAKYEQMIRRVVTGLRERYFRSVAARPAGTITHHGNCKIHAIDDPRLGQRGGFCTCGLIHDMKFLPSTLAKKIYPYYWTDRMNGERYPNEDAEKLSGQIFESLGFRKMELSEIQLAENDREENEIIRDILGENYTSL
jgi:hypothetical protein